MIENPYNTGWTRLFTQLSDKFLLATCPYAEELQIEPRGLLNYFVPIMTEIFVDSKPERKFVGGMICDDYEDYRSDEKSKPHASTTVPLRLSPYAEKVFNDLHATINGILAPGDANLSDAFLTLSCLYTCGEVEKIHSIVENTDISDEAKRLFLKYCGDES